MILYIVRHGETTWNALRKIQGATDIELNEKGIAYAKLTGEALAEVKFDLAISSPLKRAMDTARYVLNGRNIPIHTDKRIQEISFGIMEGSQIEGVFEKEFDYFFHDTKKYSAPKGGESLEDVCRRTREFWEELTGTESLKDATILIATHGCAGRALLQSVYKGGDFWHGCVPPNCSVNIVEVKNGEARLLAEDKIYYKKPSSPGKGSTAEA